MRPPELTPGELLPWRRVFALLTLSDVSMVLLGLVLGHELRYVNSLDNLFARGTPVMPMWYLFPLAAVWLVAFRLFGLYERPNLVSGIGEYRRILTAGGVTTLAIIVFAYLREQPTIARGFLLMALVSTVALVSLGRFWVRRYVYAQWRHGRPLDRVIVVGTGRQATAVARQLADSASASMRVLGFVSEYMPKGSVPFGSYKVLGEPLDLEQIATETGATRALVVESGMSWESLQAMVGITRRRGALSINLIPGLFDVHATQMSPLQLGPVLALAPNPARIAGVNAAIKRTLDLAVGIPLVLVALPIVATFSLAAVLSGRGLGLQPERVVGPREHFTMWHLDGPEWARRAHLTRLPNLLLVLLGRMSLLGPRPVLKSRAEAYSGVMANLESAKPGFIGPWWLVDKARPEDIEAELGLDLYYLRNYSVWLDIQILVHVARALVTRRWDLEPSPIPVARLDDADQTLAGIATGRVRTDPL